MPELTPPNPPLSSGRVLIRPPGNGDVEAITAACQDETTARFTRIPWPYTEDHAKTFVEECRQGWKDGTSANFVGIDLHSGQLLGSMGLVIDGRDATAEIGYWVAPGARRSGVATTMGWLVVRFGFDELDLARISLIAATTNEGSNRVAARLGFTHEGVLRAAHLDGPSSDGDAPRVDANIHGLLPGELRDPEEDTDE